MFGRKSKEQRAAEIWEKYKAALTEECKWWDRADELRRQGNEKEAQKAEKTALKWAGEVEQLEREHKAIIPEVE